MSDQPQQTPATQTDIVVPPPPASTSSSKKRWDKQKTIIAGSAAGGILLLVGSFMIGTSIGMSSGRNAAEEQYSYDRAVERDRLEQEPLELKESTDEKLAEPKQKPTEEPKFSINLQYPEGWKVSAAVGGSNGRNHTTTTAVSPTGTKLTAMVWYGGLGADCQPGPNDKPYQKGNICPTTEILSKEALGTSVQEGGKTHSLYLITQKFTSAAGKSTYLIGIVSDELPIEVNKPYTGAILAITSFSNDAAEFSIYATSDKEAFLTNTEGKQVKDALKTFKISNDESLYPELDSSIRI